VLGVKAAGEVLCFILFFSSVLVYCLLQIYSTSDSLALSVATQIGRLTNRSTCWPTDQPAD